tara:strand:+ start:715 stop:939 length:225 start_codon:yes stop_codon:yes gene_type:complete
MTIVELEKLVGQNEYVNVKAMICMAGKNTLENTLEIEVSIVDLRTSWGDLMVKVEPTAGNGFAWMSLASVRIAS